MNVSTKLLRIATIAKQHPNAPLTTLAHHLDLDWMVEAYRRTRKDGATGIDRQTASMFAENLEENLLALLEQAKSGRYRAPPVRRVYIPKAGGKRRPIGVPTFADKVMQRAIAMLLEPIFEEDFLDCSYGFRPGRSAHGALEALWQAAMRTHGRWVVELDIKGFFDAMNHQTLMEMLRERIGDGVVLRLIGKWLKAGVMENGRYHRPEAGSPQGGVISPILANLYLHVVLDKWLIDQVKPRLQGRCELIRYADDAVLVFEVESDARRVFDVLPKRFARYHLELHPDKTRLVRFQRPFSRDSPSQKTRPETFDFLGFTHFWARIRSGGWILRRKTARDRFSRAIRSIWEWCRSNLHLPIREQWWALCQKLNGHYGYYGIQGNSWSLRRFWHRVTYPWRRRLKRRSQKAKRSWSWFLRLMGRFPLPQGRVRKHRLAKR